MFSNLTKMFGNLANLTNFYPDFDCIPEGDCDTVSFTNLNNPPSRYSFQLVYSGVMNVCNISSRRVLEAFAQLLIFRPKDAIPYVGAKDLTQALGLLNVTWTENVYNANFSNVTVIGNVTCSEQWESLDRYEEYLRWLPYSYVIDRFKEEAALIATATLVLIIVTPMLVCKISKVRECLYTEKIDRISGARDNESPLLVNEEG